VNDPKQQGDRPELPRSVANTDTHSLEELVLPLSASVDGQFADELATLTLNTFIESITQANRILATHRLTGEFLRTPSTFQGGRSLPPPPSEQSGGLVILRPSPGRKLIVLGDIHGDLGSLLSILSQSKASERIQNGEDLYLLGLGDYINKGPHSLESVYIFSRLLSDPIFKGRVILLRGNHENRYGGEAKEETYLRKRFFTSIENHPLSKVAQPSALRLAMREVAQCLDELPHTLYSPCGLLAAHCGYSQWILDHNKKKIWEAFREWPPHQPMIKDLLHSSIKPESSSKDREKNEYPSPSDVYRVMKKLEVTLLLRGHQAVAPKPLDPHETWKSGYWHLNDTEPPVHRGILTLNSSRFSGPALPAYAEVSLTRMRIGLEDCTLYSLPAEQQTMFAYRSPPFLDPRSKSWHRHPRLEVATYYCYFR
jgi:hypothetical protein